VAGKVSKKLKRQSRTLAQAIGAVVTQLRIEREWSQELLGRKAGYSTAWVNKLENGKVNPTLELVIVLADIFKLTLSQFFSRAERKHLRSGPDEGEKATLRGPRKVR
jgi:transcriptional regulator with XRE-family HTH domain